MKAWLGAVVEKKPDFLGLAQYEHMDVNKALGDVYGVIGSGCYAAGKKKEGDVIGLAYDTTKWTLDRAFPLMPHSSTDTCPIPQSDGLGSDVMCAADRADHPDVQGCCGCVGNPSYDDGGGALGARAFAAGLFSKNDGSGQLCVVTASLPHPKETNVDAMAQKATAVPFDTKLQIPVLNQTILNLCGNSEILFLGDTNLSYPTEKFQDLFEKGSALNKLCDATGEPGFTCCADTVPPPPGFAPAAPTPAINRYASDRIALSCQSRKDVSVVGGGPAQGRACAGIYDTFADTYPCNGSKEEHCPVRTSFAWRPDAFAAD